jgi:hypothetical protein
MVPRIKPKEKARLLIERFTDLDSQQINNPINCALVCVEEILIGYDTLEYYPEDLRQYWEEVIKELNE